MELWRLRSPFRSRSVAKNSKSRTNFDVEIHAPEIANAKAHFDESLKRVFSNWRARIRGKLEHGLSGRMATVSVDFKAGHGHDKEATFRETIELPLRGEGRCLIDQTSFEILIFNLEGRQTAGIHVGELREYLSEFGGVSIYDTGFRLPYYSSGRDDEGREPAQDWLGIAADQGRRISVSDLLPDTMRIPQRYMLGLPAPGRLFGAVDVDTGHERAAAGSAKLPTGKWLEISPGRDRLLGSDAYSQLRDLVRFSLDFYTNRFAFREAQRVEEYRDREPASAKQARAMSVLERHEKAIPAAIYREVRREFREAADAAQAQEDVLDRRAALLAPLASAGMAALALNHELERENRFLQRAIETLKQVAADSGLPVLTSLAREFETARTRLSALQELFAPLLSEMDKSAEARLKVLAIARQTVSSMKVLMPGVDIYLRDIPEDLLFPVGALAEWNALLQNVLSNAWNAMLDTQTSKVRMSGGRTGRTEWVRISDTGKGLGVSPQDAARYFEPFERGMLVSEQRQSLALGGQGLGLAIVRMIARRRGADVRFVDPEPGYSTTLELSWKG